MGLTYARAFVNSHAVSPEQLTILEKGDTSKIAQLQSLGLGQIVTDVAKIREANLVILSVKPQDAPDLFANIKEYVHADQVVLSIMAGITIDTISSGLQAHKVIRAMPNLPSQIGVGMTAFTSTAEVSKLEEQWIQNLLQTTGKAINVQDEKLIDAVTAISGSGPAYIYYFMESMINAAKDMGVTASVAEMLVKQTFTGALDLYKQNNLECKEWIQKVASKGGTTEAAIKHFDKAHLNEIIAGGAKAALKRAEELGK